MAGASAGGCTPETSGRGLGLSDNFSEETPLHSPSAAPRIRSTERWLLFPSIEVNRLKFFGPGWHFKNRLEF